MEDFEITPGTILFEGSCANSSNALIKLLNRRNESIHYEIWPTTQSILYAHPNKGIINPMQHIEVKVFYLPYNQYWMYGRNDEIAIKWSVAGKNEMINEVKVQCKFQDNSNMDESFREMKQWNYDKEAETENFQLKDEKIEPLPVSHTNVAGAHLHAKFNNIPYSQFKQRFPGLHIGDFIFRPSIKGANHLTLSWKVDEGLERHIDIMQNADDERLLTDGRLYDDLNAVANIYMRKMIEIVQAVVNSPRYRKIEWDDDRAIDEQLKAMQAAYQKPYFFTHFGKYPSQFLLAYLDDGMVYTDRVKVTIDGLLLANTFFDSLEKMTDYCDKHLYKNSLSD